MTQYRNTNRLHHGQKGYVLLVLMLVITLMLIGMAMEAPRIAQQIKRQKEEELVHRGLDYATAVKRFVHKNGGQYPLSIDQLENTNHVRFLRKKYVDPMTGESDWKLIHAGEAQINIPTPPGGNPGLAGSGNPGLLQGNNNNTTSFGTTSATPSLQANQPNTSLAGGNTQLGLSQPQPGNNGQLGSLTTSNIGNGQTVGGGQIIGVASTSKKTGIKEFNDKDEYDNWYFVYDLRLEQSGGTGVTVAAPRVNGSGGNTTGTPNGTTGANGQTQPSGQPSQPNGQQPTNQTPTANPAPTPQ